MKRCRAELSSASQSPLSLAFEMAHEKRRERSSRTGRLMVVVNAREGSMVFVSQCHCCGPPWKLAMRGLSDGQGGA